MCILHGINFFRVIGDWVNDKMEKNGVRTNSDTTQTKEEINNAIREMSSKAKRVKISGLKGQDSIAIGVQEKIEITINGTAGDYLGAFNNGGILILHGDCGKMCGDSMGSGGMIIMGNAGHGIGTCMHNGIIVVKGNVDGDIGINMSGGMMIIDGDVKGDIGCGMTGGTLVITGDVGGSFGKNWKEGIIYIGGKKPLIGHEEKPRTLNRSQELKLGKYFDHYNINVTPSTLTIFERRGP